MIKADVAIVGSGVSGLYCALNLPRELKIAVFTKAAVEESDSFLAQGGICVLRDENDYDSFFEDTMRAGHYENNKQSVDIMIRSSRDVINTLIDYGVDFERDENGALRYTKEGAHSNARILFHEDITGKEITSKLYEAVKKLDNVEIIENFTMVDIISKDNTCLGLIGIDCNGIPTAVKADCTVFATGGIGGLYRASTNFPHLTGDSIAISIKHSVELLDVDYVQIHPTSLYTKEKGRKFLISESCRGEGALLLDAKMERFTDELQPRDVVSKAIFKQMEKDKTEHVWLDLRPIGEKTIFEHFPNIYKKCLECGYDVTKECIPITPAQHYFMGGIKVNSSSKTTMDALYAVGETACNGVHGANRLASNSLLEAIVFSSRAAKEIGEEYLNMKKASEKLCEGIDFDKKARSEEYSDLKKLGEEYAKMVLDEIEKERSCRE